MFWLKSSSSPVETSRARDTRSPCAPWWRPPGCAAQPLTTSYPPIQEDGEQHAAATHKAHGAADVVGCGEATVAEGRFFPQQPAVVVCAAEPQPQSARAR